MGLGQRHGEVLPRKTLRTDRLGHLAIDFEDPLRQTMIAVAHESSKLSRSTDGGATWTHLDGGGIFDPPNTTGPTIAAILVDAATAGSSTNSTVFAATSIGLYKSTNSGSTWTLALGG